MSDFRLTSDPKFEGSNPAPVGTELMKMADIKIKCLISHKVADSCNLSQALAGRGRQ